VPNIGPAIEQPLQPPIVTELPSAPVKVAARLSTPSDLLRPPYPETKRRLEEEATLRLRLSIDERGRVTAVEPIGAADPEFLSSARRHLIRHWRYKPATEDGRAVPSVLNVTLRFRLEDV
jgi:protein TonB